MDRRIRRGEFEGVDILRLRDLQLLQNLIPLFYHIRKMCGIAVERCIKRQMANEEELCEA